MRNPSDVIYHHQCCSSRRCLFSPASLLSCFYFPAILLLFFCCLASHPHSTCRAYHIARVWGVGEGHPPRNFTKDCLDLADHRHCEVFIRCCDRHCQNSTDLIKSDLLLNSSHSSDSEDNDNNNNTEVASMSHCYSILGQINEEKTKCICTFSAVVPSSAWRATSRWHGDGAYLSRLDFIGGVLLIFAVDLLLLSLTL